MAEGGYLIRPADMARVMDAVEQRKVEQAQEEMRKHWVRFAPGVFEVMARAAKGER